MPDIHFPSSCRQPWRAVPHFKLGNCYQGAGGKKCFADERWVLSGALVSSHRDLEFGSSGFLVVQETTELSFEYIPFLLKSAS